MTVQSAKARQVLMSDELNEAIIQVMLEYRSDDEVKWFSMVENPLLKLEE